MSRRWKLLMGLAAAGAVACGVFVVVAATHESEAESRAKRFREGMTDKEVVQILGKPKWRFTDGGNGGCTTTYQYPDMSVIFVYSTQGSLVNLEETDTTTITDVQAEKPLPWHERLRNRLRALGLPV